MKASKLGLLLVILLFGSTVETAWRVRNQMSLGPTGCRVLGGRFYGPSFSFEEARPAVFEGSEAIEVENAFGAVRVSAVEPGATPSLAVRKVVFLPTEEKAREFAGRILVQTEKRNGALHLSTNRRDLERDTAIGEGVGFETHLTLTVTPGTRVRVTNSHGEVTITDVAQATVEASYEPVRVERIGGPAVVDVRHGDVVVTNVKGTLSVESRHGNVKVEDVEQAVSIQAHHGDVTAARVGALTLTTSHGDVSLDGVKGDLKVNGQHSGVRAVGVAGRAEVETSFRDVHVDRVTGDVVIRSQHGGVRVVDVGGSVDAEASFGQVEAERIKGAVMIAVEHGGVRGESLEQGGRVKASGDDVAIESFKGALEVDAERAGVSLRAEAVTGALRVTTTHGGITLTVPADSRFALEASAEGGEIQAQVPGLVITQQDTHRVKAQKGEGGATVTLAADHGDVTVNTSTAVAAASDKK